MARIFVAVPIHFNCDDAPHILKIRVNVRFLQLLLQWFVVASDGGTASECLP